MKQAGGAHKTVSDRMALAERFCKRLVTELNVQIRNVRHLNARHIEDYIRHRLAQGFGQKRRWPWWRWSWGTVTDAGGMWRRCTGYVGRADG